MVLRIVAEFQLLPHERDNAVTKTLWELPFASSWGGWVKLFELPQRNLALFFQGEDVDDRIVFEQVEAYKCTFYFARTDDMSVAYDKNC